MLDYSIFQNQNRWRTETDFFQKTTFLNRVVFDDISKWLDDDEILVLSGSRQVGKSTLMYMVIKHLLKKKNIAVKDILYFNLDERALQTFF